MENLSKLWLTGEIESTRLTALSLVATLQCIYTARPQASVIIPTRARAQHSRVPIFVRQVFEMDWAADNARLIHSASRIFKYSLRPARVIKVVRQTGVGCHSKQKNFVLTANVTVSSSGLVARVTRGMDPVAGCSKRI